MSGDPLAGTLDSLLEGATLTPVEATAAFEAIMDGHVPPARLAAFLIALRLRGETVDEIAAFARVMRARVTPVRAAARDTIDTCGTGGDRSGTFNISTLAAIVAAAAGAPVAKHGNRSVSSRCGSADLLAGLGVDVQAPISRVEQALAEIGIGFLYAPMLHGAMRHAAPVRRELGVRTVFNLLGPLTNPAGARRQLLGVYDAAWVEPIARVLLELGSVRAMVVHGAGLDEIALHGETRVAEVREGGIRVFLVSPADAGLETAPLQTIAGGDVQANVAFALGVLRGDKGPRRDVVLLNAAAAIVIGDRAADLREGAALAARAIDSGAALQVLERLKAICPVPGAGD